MSRARRREHCNIIIISDGVDLKNEFFDFSTLLSVAFVKSPLYYYTCILYFLYILSHRHCCEHQRKRPRRRLLFILTRTAATHQTVFETRAHPCDRKKPPLDLNDIIYYTQRLSQTLVVVIIGTKIWTHFPFSKNMSIAITVKY